MKKKLIYLLVAGLVVCSILPASSVVLASPATKTLRPDGVGNYTNIGIQQPDAGAHWDKVDEAVADGATTYIKQVGLTQKIDAYTLTASDIPDGATINSVTVHFVWFSGSESWWAYLQPILYLDSANTTGTEIQTKSSSSVANSEALARPGGGVWVAADLADLQVGVGLKTENAVTSSVLTQIYVVVDFTPAAPSITTNAATNVATTTARLNSVLTDDGGESCNVSFQYNTIENWLTCENTTWVAGYNTEGHPYADISGLIINTPYYFRVRAANTGGTTNGTALTFTTSSGLEEPTNFKAFPLTTSVTLSWTNGIGSTTTLVRYGTGTYPTTTGEGFLVYSGVLNSYTHSGVVSGNPYFYSAWGISGDNTSVSYATVMVTTLGTPTATGDPTAPGAPTTWFSTPDYTKFSNLTVVYDLVNKFADALGMPRSNFWMLSSLFGCMLFGIVVGAGSRHTPPAMIALSVSIGISSLIGLMPMWMMLFAVLFIIGAWQFSSERRIG